MVERNVKRYSAYFRGWCQAFGEHDSYGDHDRGIIGPANAHHRPLGAPRHRAEAPDAPSSARRPHGRLPSAP